MRENEKAERGGTLTKKEKTSEDERVRETGSTFIPIDRAREAPRVG